MAERVFLTDIFHDRVKADGINGKAKGNANERDCAKSMSVWTGEKFARVPGSGSLRWKDSRDIAADLVCENRDFEFPFTVETKHLASLKIQSDLPYRSRIFTIWEQVLYDAKRCGKLPLAMLRENGMHKFKYNGEKYQDYYFILDARFGGYMPATSVAMAFSGRNEDKGFDLIGYNFSAIVHNYSYPRLLQNVTAKDLLTKFKNYYSL